MKNRELIDMIRAQKPDLPDSLDARIQNQLARLIREEQAMKKRVKFQTVLIAAVIFVALMSTAFALGYSNLMEYLGKGRLKPLDGSETLVQTDFGDAFEKDDIIFHVEEAIFDGKTAVVQLLITPSDPENVFLLHDGIQDTPESEYEVECIPDRSGGEYRKIVGRKDGKQIISYSASLKAADEQAGYVFESNTLDGEALSDGSVRVWMEGSVVSGTAEKLDLIIRSTYAPLEQMDELEKRCVFEKEITLTSGQEANKICFKEIQNDMDARVRILAVSAQMHALRGEMTVDYAYDENTEKAPMGITFKMYAGGEEITVGSESTTLLEIMADGKMLYRSVFEIEALEAFPEKITLEAKVIGKPETLGQAEFSIGEIENPPETTAETVKPGLYFVPVGSWTGENITLFKGEIYEGRKIVLSYSCTQDQLMIPDVRFMAPDGTGAGEIINQTTVIKGDSYTMEAFLGGSGWPPSLRIEFVLNNEVIDSFECELLPFKG